ncbi:MAG: type 4a pilus biogenesis protein PilO [Pyrinomonadaceae bacterium]
MPKIGNLQELPWYYQLGVFGGLALVVYFGFGYFVTSGTRAEAKELNDKVAVLQGQNAQAQIASQRLNEFRAAYKSRQEEYDELKSLLPEQRELTSVLAGVQDRARGSRLSLRRFSPKDDVQQDFYSGKPIEVAVNSSFVNLRQFFDQMARYQRIVSISDFKINQATAQNHGSTIDAQFVLTAYYVSAEKLQKAATPPVPAAAPAAAPVAAAPAAK